MNRYAEDDEESAQTPKQASPEAMSLFPISGGRAHGITIPYRLRYISAKRLRSLGAIRTMPKPPLRWR